MIDPKILAAIGTIVIAVITFLLGILIPTMPPEVKNLFWNYILMDYRISVHPGVILVLIIVPSGLFLWALNYIMIREKGKRQHLELSLAQAHEQLRQLNLLRFLDEVTGIPNEAKLQVDFPELGNRTTPSSMIIIDLDGFGEINNRFGYEKGDDVIRYIASDTYNAMRRDENVYKIPYSLDTGLRGRIYRKYTGGDEFIFVLNGDERAALGYLRRLKRRFDNDISRHIRDEILKHPWSLRFHAGVCPLETGDTYEDAKKRVESCLRRAKQRGSTRCVVWFSNRKSTDFPIDSPMAGLYAEAEKEFALE
jgi:diguanylate cyclase (GGDEF)-like protein